MSIFGPTDTANTCYSCNPCGDSFNPSVATPVATGSSSDYCRKTVTGSLVVKDSTSSCTTTAIFGSGIYCCSTDLCNGGNSIQKQIPLFVLTGIFFITFIYENLVN
ncbi:unnamed protein product [Didymodactylos carnosus]|uniref:Uncharacterized protein n=1 Tax=Didymodactylos carnosus TaxID=1234261 RepID=A0A8S2HMZ3_9BILA|nr:unnamed protein product [Didymodactylos carnosus]CAF3660888.1 unnamed protein product [Didymodactylos carnosus]